MLFFTVEFQILALGPESNKKYLICLTWSPKVQLCCVAVDSRSSSCSIGFRV